MNLEVDMPTVAVAIQRFKNALMTHKRQGGKAVIVIHGYGSTGVGGGIKAGVVKCLQENNMRGIVRAFVPGEHWSSKKRDFIGMCKALENHERQIANNDGVTVVILR